MFAVARGLPQLIMRAPMRMFIFGGIFISLALFIFLPRLHNTSVKEYVEHLKGVEDLDVKAESNASPLSLQSLSDGKLHCHSWNVLLSDKSANVLVKHEFPRLNASVVTEDSGKRQESFIEIFNKKMWKGQERASNSSENIIGSGPGSTLEKTKNVRKTLHVVIEQVKTWLKKSKIRMLDIPCGDLTWMSQFMKNRTDVEYHGMDIVPAIIEHHKKVYTPKYPHMTFTNQDIVAQPLKMKYDLIHTRQMTQHLTSEDTLKVLRHFIDSGSHFLMATTVPSVGEVELDHFNRGRHRLQNLEKTPYSLPAPICRSQDVSVEHNAVWRLH